MSTYIFRCRIIFIPACYYGNCSKVHVLGRLNSLTFICNKVIKYWLRIMIIIKVIHAVEKG